MASADARLTLSREQVDQYFDRLQISERKRIHDVSRLSNEDALKYLALIQKQHLVHIPFENLALHYSPFKQISLHWEELFRKIIADQNGRGGYCMENNRLLATLLLTLGFTLYTGGGRVFDDGNWTGFGHMVILVTIGETKYHVDVGFGGNGPVVPMPLDMDGTIQEHISPASARLQYRNIPGNCDPNQRLWVYEHREGAESDWNLTYCFTELEFLPNDYAVMNYNTSTNIKTFFTRIAMAVNTILDEKGDFKGSLILFGNSIKWRTHGVKEKEIEFKSEQDRLDALEKYFGIKFTQTERDSIRGYPSEIK